MHTHLSLRLSRMLLCCGVLAAVPLAAGAEPAAFSQKPFTDVPTSSPYYQAIEYLRANTIFKGYLDGTFRPERRITRADFVQLMTNAFFLHGREDNCLQVNVSPDVSKVFFADVHKGDSFATDVCVAKMHDLIHGYPDGTFRPGYPISFVEAAKIVVRVFALKQRQDDPLDARWYTVYVQTLADYHAIPASINPASMRSLARPIKRGEVAQMIYLLTQAQRNQ